MRIGVPKEIKPQENRIGLTPDSVKVLVSNGHKVLIENNGEFESGFDNNQYENAGGKIVNKAEDIFNDSEIIVKVKEPLSNEIKLNADLDLKQRTEQKDSFKIIYGLS